MPRNNPEGMKRAAIFDKDDEGRAVFEPGALRPERPDPVPPVFQAPANFPINARLCPLGPHRPAAQCKSPVWAIPGPDNEQNQNSDWRPRISYPRI